MNYKVIMIYLCLFLSLTLIPVGKASWQDRLQVSGEVHTGNWSERTSSSPANSASQENAKEKPEGKEERPVTFKDAVKKEGVPNPSDQDPTGQEGPVQDKEVKEKDTGENQLASLEDNKGEKEADSGTVQIEEQLKPSDSPGSSSIEPRTDNDDALPREKTGEDSSASSSANKVGEVNNSSSSDSSENGASGSSVNDED